MPSSVLGLLLGLALALAACDRPPAQPEFAAIDRRDDPNCCAIEPGYGEARSQPSEELGAVGPVTPQTALGLCREHVTGFGYSMSALFDRPRPELDDYLARGLAACAAAREQGVAASQSLRPRCQDELEADLPAMERMLAARRAAPNSVLDIYPMTESIDRLRTCFAQDARP